MNRRNLLRAIGAGALAATGQRAAAQIGSARPIHLIVAFSPGGPSDQIARVLVRSVGNQFGGPLVVDYKPGAGGTVGVEFAARAPADGSTLLIGSSSNLTIGPALDSSLRYDPIRDFVALGRLGQTPLILVARSALPIRNAAELIAYARRKPGALTYGSGAAMVQFAMESLKATAGIDIVHVPYKGNAPALMDVVAGHVDLALVDVAAAAPHVESGTLRVIANGGKARARAFAQVPTMVEQGFDFEFDSWQALLAPRATPAEFVARVQGVLQTVLKSEEFVQALQAVGFEPIHEPPAAFAALLQGEVLRYQQLARRLPPGAVRA